MDFSTDTTDKNILEFKPKPPSLETKISLIELPKNSLDSFTCMILENINNIKSKVNEFLQTNLKSGKPINKSQYILTNGKLFKINVPLFSFIIQNPLLTQIPSRLLSNYIGETNYSGQTPLMLSVIIDNIQYVKQLIKYDIGKIDEFDKSALDYAYEFNVSQEIIDLLEQYEYGS